MIYPANFENKIGFDRIRQKLKEFCFSSMGTDRVDIMCFSNEAQTIINSLDQVQEYINIINSNEDFPLEYVIDCRKTLTKLIPENSYPEVDELFKLRQSLDTIKNLYGFFNKNQEKYPQLWTLARPVKLYPYIENRIDSILTGQGKIKDNASQQLLQIRRNIQQLNIDISRRMQHLLSQCKKEGITEEDASLAIRDGRLVLPVITTFKRKIKGFIYDESATGKTTFIEPSEVVELNNDLKELELSEKREIIRILTQLANEIRPYIPDLLDSYNFLGEIDFIQAKTMFAREIEAVRPAISNEKPVIDWYNAIHPLLYLHFKEENKQVVPLNIHLNDKARILVISGPNAGGKSVCLQTVGLLQYMVQCGLPIPVKETSDVGIFDNIFMDIGDEQSIDNDLSTYSSHLLNMKFFIKNANERTLFLIDEFGSGTEPIIGGAIAESVLEELNQKGAYGIVTTHYTNLKQYASSAPNVINGAMLFDTEHLIPLFQLMIGEPGSSFAFEIARKIGLPENILQKATEKVGSGYVDYDRNLRQIIRDKHYWQQKRNQVKDSARKLDELVQKYGTELNEISTLRKEIISKAKNDALQIIADTNKTIENTIRTIKESQAEKEKTRIARNEIVNLKNQIASPVQEEERILHKMEQLKEREKRKNRNRKQLEENNKVVKPDERDIDKYKINIGDKVKLYGQDTVGEVIDINGKSIMVAFGNMVTTLPETRLEKISNNEFKQLSKQSSTLHDSSIQQLSERRQQFKLQLDVRGMRANEALEKVSDYIDDAIMLGVSEVRILHGKGNGILRQMIRDYLKTIDMVTSFSDEHVDFGGAGITVVKLG
jgi:DNA mismatch repair protein MutS2